MGTAHGAAQRERASAGAEPLTLIHRNKSPKQALARVCGELPARRYSLEWGVSDAVVVAAFAIASQLVKGGYAKST